MPKMPFNPHPSQGRRADALLLRVSCQGIPIRLIETQGKPFGQVQADSDLYRREFVGTIRRVVAIPEFSLFFDRLKC